MYQTYEEKMDLVLRNLYPMDKNNPLITGQPNKLSFAEYHEILKRENVIIINSPVFALDLSTMKRSETITTGGFVKTNIITFSVETYAYKNINDINWPEDTLYFFFTGYHQYDDIHLRYFKINKILIKDALDRQDALCRINTKYSLNNEIDVIREYVASEQFQIDRELVKKPIDDLGIIYIKNKENLAQEDFLYKLRGEDIKEFKELITEEFKNLETNETKF